MAVRIHRSKNLYSGVVSTWFQRERNLKIYMHIVPRLAGEVPVGF